MCLPRLDGAAIIGHDRLDELLVVQVVVRSRALQLLDSSLLLRVGASERLGQYESHPPAPDVGRADRALG